MPLLDRRQEYSWPATRLERVQLLPERKQYTLDEILVLNLGFRVIGGGGGGFKPHRLTGAWGELDKNLRLTARAPHLSPREPLQNRLVGAAQLHRERPSGGKVETGCGKD